MTVHDEVAQRCADIAAGLTIPALLHRNAHTYPQLPALSTLGVDGAVTWLELRDRVAELSRGLAGLGLGPGDRMIMMMPSRLEHWLVDLAAVHLGAIPCTAYATLSPDQLRYLGQHSAAKALVVSGRAELDKWLALLPELPQLTNVVAVDEEEVLPGTTSLAAVIAHGASAHDPETPAPRHRRPAREHSQRHVPVLKSQPESLPLRGHP